MYAKFPFHAIRHPNHESRPSEILVFINFEKNVANACMIYLNRIKISPLNSILVSYNNEYMSMHDIYMLLLLHNILHIFFCTISPKYLFTNVLQSTKMLSTSTFLRELNEKINC